MASFTKPGLSHHTTLGGTGISIDRTDQGSLLIGDGTGFKLNTLIGGTGISIVNGDGTITISGTPAYTLPIASASVLGGIKVGANLSIDGGGVLSGAAPYTLPIASPTILGGIKVGTNLTIDIAGVLSATAAPYTLPVASVSVLGGVKQGSNVTIDGSGVISVAAPYTLPIASPIILGGIKVGSGLAIDGGGILSTTGVPAGVSVGASVWNSSAQAITNSLATIISWDTVLWDTDGIHPAASTRLTCHTAGYYLVWANISWDAPTTDSQVLFLVNTTQAYEGTTTAIDANSDAISTSTVIHLSPGDYVECRVLWQGSGGPINVGSTSNPRTPRFGIQMLTAGTTGGMGGGGESVNHGGVLVGTRPSINFIDGANVALTIADNGGTNAVDITVAVTDVDAGGGASLSVYQTIVMADTPVGFWPLTEQGTAAGSVYKDTSGNLRDVTVKVGTVTHVDGITAGTTAPYFGDATGTRTSDALWTSNTLGLPVNNQAYTLEGWIKPSPSLHFDLNSEPLGNAGYEAWMAYGKPYLTGGLRIGSDFVTSAFPGGTLDNVLKFSGQTNASSSTRASLHAPLGTGTWHHVVVSDNAAGTMKVYVDGYLVLSFGSAGHSNGLVYNVANVLYFGDPGLVSGSYPSPLGEEYVGALSHMAIYNYVLTDAQVLIHFMAAKTTSESPDLVPNVMAYSDTLTTAVASNTSVPVPFVWTRWDNGSPTPQHDNSVNNTRLTCTEDGLYKVTGRISWLSEAYDGFLAVRIWKNRASDLVETVGENTLYVNGNPNNIRIVQTVTGEVTLAIGDFVELLAFQLSASTTTRHLSSSAGDANNFTHSRLQMYRIG